MALPLLASLGISMAPSLLTGLGHLFGFGGGKSKNQEALRRLLMGQIQGGFEGSNEWSSLQEAIKRQRGIAEEETQGIFGKVAGSVSGRGLLAPPGEGRGALGALQLRTAQPIQQRLQSDIAGMTSGAMQQYGQNRLQMISQLMGLEEQIPGLFDSLMASIQGGTNLFGALAPYTKGLGR